jgi:hypothetical protein
MTSIQTYRPQVNTPVTFTPANITPAFRQVRDVNTGAVKHYLAEPYAAMLLEALFNTGIYNAAEITADEASEGNDGFTVCVGGQHVRISFTPVPFESWEDTHEQYDAMSPDAEDAERMAMFGHMTEAELISTEFNAWVERMDREHGEEACPDRDCGKCPVRECVMHPDRLVPDASELDSFLASEGFPVKIR